MSQEGRRRLSAILAADVAGYTRLVEQDTDGTVAAWKTARDVVIEPAVSEHAGRLVKLTGDGFLSEFPSVQDAVSCAIAIQDKLLDSSLDFRIGIHLGDVIDDGKDIHGEGVNIAARIEALADSGGICISAAVHEQVRNRVEKTFEDLGHHDVKHVSAPVRVYRIGTARSATVPVTPSQIGTAGKPSIAVLPFDNMSGDAEQDYFSDGITEDIITALSRFRWFFVIARNSTFSYKGQSTDVKQVGHDLSVRYVLDGSVRKAGNRVRITVQLIEADTGNHIWAERYDRSLEDIFELQDEIARTVIGAIEPEISRAEQDRAKRKPPENLDAWENYQRGMFCFYQGTPEGFDEAEGYFAKATKLDPEFSAAFGMYARTFSRRAASFLREDAEVFYARAIAAAKRAVILDPIDPSAHVALGFALESSDVDAAVRSLEEALSLNPDSALVHFALGRMLTQARQPQRGVGHLKTAIGLSPRDSLRGVWFWNISEAYFALGELEQVVEWSSRATHTPVITARVAPVRIAALALLGEKEQATTERAEFLSRYPAVTVSNLLARNVALGGTDDYRAGLEEAGFPP